MEGNGYTYIDHIIEFNLYYRFDHRSGEYVVGDFSRYENTLTDRIKLTKLGPQNLYFVEPNKKIDNAVITYIGFDTLHTYELWESYKTNYEFKVLRNNENEVIFRGLPL